ncbi:MAG: alpha-ketoacid dehydrogenase subunit beta [Gammaproteobacteria bacterium]|jgi:pyruvate dehydrogenase E1 component beta subunit
MADWTLLDGVNRAFASEMRRDENVVVLGEDVGVNGGVFRATAGLLEEFGPGRVIDTPLAETVIVGMAIGMAAQGLKPVAELQFMGFIYPAVDQVINHAARLRNRTRGRVTCPMVIRAPFGGGIHAPEHHSESTEALFAHMPGVRVVIPSSPARAYGLLLASIRDPDPVVFLEPKRIYRHGKQSVEDNGESLPLDTCFVLRDGVDVTLVSWGASIRETLEAAGTLAQNGVDAEVIDVATVSPLDMDTILDSVARTGRCVIVHEAARNCGIGAEIAARLAGEGLTSLLAPVKRVTGFDTVMPLYRHEDEFMPGVNRILDAVQETMEYR